MIGDEAGRGWLGLVVAALCAVAVARLPTGENTPGVAEAARAVPRKSEGVRGNWRVQIDGWAMEFDSVEPAAVVPQTATLIVPDSAGNPFSSPYDPLIQFHARNHGLDWRVVSAVIQVESGFRPNVESDKGAFGLMQVRSVAAEEVGEASYRTPDANIRTGVRYLKHLEAMFDRAVDRDRLALTLAAYHMGPAHVRDAQDLARRYGYDPWKWDGSMDRILPLLEQPALYLRLPNGYARGLQTLEYVDKVFDRYARHRRATLTVSSDAAQAASAAG